MKLHYMDKRNPLAELSEISDLLISKDTIMLKDYAIYDRKTRNITVHSKINVYILGRFLDVIKEII